MLLTFILYKIYRRKDCFSIDLFMAHLTTTAFPSPAPYRAVVGLSAALLLVERMAITGLMFLLTGLILACPTSRYHGLR